MMGEHAKQNELWVEPVNLARRIPEDHPLRKLKGVLQLDFVRDEVGRFYGANGNVSVDPVIIMKMMLLLFWDNVASERELMRTIPLRIDYLWFLGYGLEDEIPHHSVLSKARKRWGKEVFEGLFGKTVGQCLEAGLIDGSKLHVDSSLVRADASLNCVVAVTMAKLDEQEQQEAPVDEDQKGGGINEKNKVTTDPDSTLVRHRTGKSLPSYKNHRALDDKAGVITVSKTTTGIRDDGAELLAVLEAHETTTGGKAKVVVGDSKYGITTNYIALAGRGIRTHMADLRGKLYNHRQQGIYGQERFAYDAHSDTFTCPAGRKLYNHHYHHQRGYHEYRARAGVCGRCRLAHLCTRAKNGRTLNRYPEQKLLDRARKQSGGPSAVRDRKRRQWFQERNFAEAATEHGFKRARWRGLEKQTIQDQLIAAIQNLKILIRKGGFASARLIAALATLRKALRSLTFTHFYSAYHVPTYSCQPI
jgi:transposase